MFVEIVGTTMSYDIGPFRLNVTHSVVGEGIVNINFSKVSAKK